MFEYSSVDARVQRRPWTLALSLALQTLALGVLLLIPLLLVEQLPITQLEATLIAPPLPAAPAPKRIEVQTVSRSRTTRAFNAASVYVFRIPNHVETIIDDADPVSPLSTTSVLGVGSLAQNLLGDPFGKRLPPPPQKPPEPKPAPAKQSGPVRQGGDVQAARCLACRPPLYPPMARTARVSGHVIMNAIIDKEGRVIQLQVIAGPALLQAAALDAVRQWRYRPTTLNGEAVEVATTIDVNFTLSQ